MNNKILNKNAITAIDDNSINFLEESDIFKTDCLNNTEFMIDDNILTDCKIDE